MVQLLYLMALQELSRNRKQYGAKQIAIQSLVFVLLTSLTVPALHSISALA